MDSFRTALQSDESLEGDTPYDPIRHTAQERLAATWSIRKPLFALALGLLGGACYLAVPMNRGCPEGEVAVNFYWYMLANFINIGMCVLPMFAMQFCGLCPGAAWPSFYVVWAFGLVWVMGSLCIMWLNGYPSMVFETTVYFGYSMVLPMWACYGVCLLCSAGGRRAPADRGLSGRARRWQAVEAEVLVANFEAGLSAHQSWMARLPSNPGVAAQPRELALDGAPRLLSHPVKQWLRLGLFMMYEESIFWILNVIMRRLTKNGVTMVVFAVFTVTAFSAKVILTGRGFILDAGKSGAQFSGYYCGHLHGTFFYYFYYRAMFEHVDDWSLFVGLQVIHLTMEWLQHVVRATEWYYNRVRATSRRLPQWLQSWFMQMFLARQPNVSYHDWTCFMALDTALQTYAIIFSGISYGIGYTMVHFIGHNRVTFAPFLDQMRGERYSKLMLQLGIQLLTEVANVCMMELWFRCKLGPAGAMRRIDLLFQSSTFRTWFIATCAAQTTATWPQFVIPRFCN